MGRRKRLVFLVAMILCANILLVNASATNLIEAKPGDVQLRYTNIRSISCVLSITGTTASCVANVTGEVGTTAINSRLFLYKYIGGAYQYVTSWTKNVATSSVSYSKNYTVQSGNYYRLYITANVYCNGSWESGSLWSSLCYCS